MYLTHFPTETMPENGWPSFRIDPNLSVCVYKQDHPQTENAAEGGGDKMYKACQTGGGNFSLKAVICKILHLRQARIFWRIITYSRVYWIDLNCMFNRGGRFQKEQKMPSMMLSFWN